ncbi:Ppx/GppA phosphatase family protein [Actinomyces faecalis]|uniref:Ppx/GppA phosphatase family protein n=1 Tax=Actinomyces faecalis TaxID=2722820 RepID=UPI001555A0EF|nr:Ppx/GppA phosphatase family protein [Actinomyces faecalis]
MTRVAAIDCGTNTIRLLVADLASYEDGTRLVQLVRENEIVRLGQGVDRTGRLDEEALERTLAVVASYAATCRAQGVERVRFVATSATRDASNRSVFVDGVRERLGVEPEVVTGQEEARLSFAGSSLCLDRLTGDVPAGPHLVVDLGGGSTELVLGQRGPQAAFSMDTGSVRVTERYLADGVTPASEASARAHVRELLDRAGDVVDLSAATRLVGLAGTITTVTAHALGLTDFDPDALDGAEVPAETMLASAEEIVHSTAAERESWAYLRPGRRDVIAAGALVWSEVITRVMAETAAGPSPVTSSITSLSDILDGIALSMADGAAAVSA